MEISTPTDNRFKFLRDCNAQITAELQEAGIKSEPIMRNWREGSVIQSNLGAWLNGWRFKRETTYWVANTECNPLLFRYADSLHNQFGTICRCGGWCMKYAPRQLYTEKWRLGVTLYHIDKQDGLNALVDMIKKQEIENPNLPLTCADLYNGHPATDFMIKRHTSRVRPWQSNKFTNR